ncbi:uncharacterized protein FTOL_11156 [Fusarium torulosum]|uniref:2EXR domain-containing protein n=1 Tax=Fusarium torulosum TaxID=33205 RepID=A0AAE8SMQ8_9HYPO|nr:uncharacterized protein FTOL_11156 [Fusarium torulosum]
MSTFHQFSDLPRELRDTIWSFAIRDDNPGVHIFGDFDNKKRHYFNSLDENRSDENVSTYLIDGGLWTACKESRLIMERHFRQSEWPKELQCDKYYGSLTKGHFNMPATGYFQGGELHCLKVFPHKDLFVLQLDDIARYGWCPGDLKSPLGKNLRGYKGVRHLAIEYRPEWAEGSYYAYDHIRRTLVDTIFEIGTGL